MKIKSLLLLIILSIALVPAFAQTTPADYSIRGIVKDSITQQPAGYVTISLKNPAKQAVKSSFTKEDGSFSLDNIPSGKYTATVFSVGYSSKVIAVDLSGEIKQTDLGTILIKGSVTQLAAVSITVDKPLIKQEVDRMSYNLQADPESKVNNVLEMMRKVPLLSVDADDNVLLKGDANYKILVNGKPSSMMERSAKDILRSMPASTIERIEVITTPPAKYDAEGVAGIINIITARKIDNGYNASLNTSHRFPVGGPGMGGSFTFKQGKFGIAANGGASQYNAPQTFSKFFRQNGNNDLTQKSHRKSDSENGYFGAELSYELDSLNLISGQFNINGGRSSNLNNQDSHQNRDGLGPQSYSLLNDNSGTGYGADAALNYQLGFKSNKARLLTFSYRYFGYGNTQLNNLDVSDAVNFNQPDYNQSNKGSSTEQTFQVDYVHPLKKINIEAGIKGILRVNKSNFQYSEQDETTNLFVINPSRTNKFNNTQDVFSAYNAYQYNLKTWGFKAGFRIEETIIDADFVSAASQLQRSYWNVVPSASIIKKFKNQSSLNLGFSQRIQRPGIYQLNPFLDTSNPNSYSTGNPNLYPTANNEFMLGYNKSKKGSLNLSFGYSFFNNLIMPVAYIDNATNITHNSFDNTGKARLFMFMTNFNYPITKKWNSSLNGRAAHGRVQGIVNGSLVKNEGIMYGANVSSGYRFEKGWRINGNFNLNGPNLSIQGTSKAFASSSFSVNKDVIKEKLSFSAAASNPFTKYRTNHTETFGTGFNQTNDSQTFFRSYSFSMNYKFGKLKEGIKKSKREIRNDDVSSGGGGN